MTRGVREKRRNGQASSALNAAGAGQIRKQTNDHCARPRLVSFSAQARLNSSRIC